MIFLLKLLDFWLLDIDFLRSTGKIYTVALVALVVWLAVLFYLIRLEKKVKSLEDQINKTK
jgi:CcmD family protein